MKNPLRNSIAFLLPLLFGSAVTWAQDSTETRLHPVDTIISDSYAESHEGFPHGLPESSHWFNGPVVDDPGTPPPGWDAFTGWGQLYEDRDGNPATNTRVEIDNMITYYLRASDQRWYQMQDSDVEGAYYVEDFAGDESIPGDQRTEPNGNASVVPGRGPQEGYNFHFWPKEGRSSLPEGDVAGVYIVCQARLIMDDPGGPDDRAQARYLMGVGGDYWESMTAVWDNWTTNGGVGVGRLKYVTPDWRFFSICTLSPEEIRQNPPPTPGSSFAQLANASFEQPARSSQAVPGWTTWSGTGDEAANYTESSGSQTEGDWHLTHYRGESGSWNCYTGQLVTGLENGRYTLRARAKKSGQGFVSSHLEAKDFGGWETVAIPTADTMQRLEITGIQVINGQCQIGLWTEVEDGTQGPGVHLDEVEFFREDIDEEPLVTSSDKWLNEATTEAEALRVYPNPNEGQFIIITQAGRVQIRNAVGQLVYQAEFSQGRHSINVSSLPSGVYVVSVGREQRRLIKQ